MAGRSTAVRRARWEKVEERRRGKRRRRKGDGEEGGGRRTDRCQGNEGNLHFVKLSLGSSRARPEHGG